MLRCGFGGTFTPPVSVLRGQVTASPPTNNPDATAELQLDLTSLACPRRACRLTKKTKTDLGRHAHAPRPHTTLALFDSRILTLLPWHSRCGRSTSHRH